MSIGSEGCNINSKNNMCEIVIEEAPKYHINSHVAVATKEGENSLEIHIHMVEQRMVII